MASLGLIAIWISFNIQKYGGAFDVYMKAESLYKITLFVPVFFGLLYTRTPWWSAIASVAAGVLSVLVVGIAAALQTEDSLSFMNILFADMEVSALGLVFTRYELNALVGLSVSGGVFIFSAFLNKRTGLFKDRIESFESDLQTPAHEDPDHKIGPEGLKAYQIMGVLAIGLGSFLLLLSIFTMLEGGWINAIVGGLAIGIGFVTLRTIRTYKRMHNIGDSL